MIYGRLKNRTHALIAQLDRVTGYEPVGRGFESLSARQKDWLKQCCLSQSFFVALIKGGFYPFKNPFIFILCF